MSDERPKVDQRNPADAVSEAVRHVLELAESWHGWDLKPIEMPIDGGPPRFYTPHKALRRVADHLVDHLAEIEARLAGEATESDHWHGSGMTTAADLAPFAAEEFDEAQCRLVRLAQIWRVRLQTLSEEQLDDDDGESWTVREIAFHVTDATMYYGDAVGNLS